MFSSFKMMFETIGKNNILVTLTQTDNLLISYAISDKPNKEIASILNLSMNTISKKYSTLLEKTGTHSKKELAKWFIDTISNY